MSENVRRQLTLFIDDRYAKKIEEIRKKYNPVQFNLIRSHVTLCREDEIENLSEVKNNLKSLKAKPIVINFKKILRFSNGNGVMILAVNNLQYDHLRDLVLKDINVTRQFPQPHITLLHPRNSICTDEIFKEIKKVVFPASICFDKISLIEQVDFSTWMTTATFQL